jgi:hypothetical protein
MKPLPGGTGSQELKAQKLEMKKKNWHVHSLRTVVLKVITSLVLQFFNNGA